MASFAVRLGVGSAGTGIQKDVFQNSFVPIPCSASNANVPAVLYDANVNQIVSVATWNNYRVITRLRDEVEVDILSEGGETYSNGVIIRGQNSSTVNVSLSSPYHADTVEKSLDMSLHGNSTFTQFVSFVEGTPSHIITDELLPLLVDGKQLNYYSTINHNTSTYTRNVNGWLYGVDLGAVACAVGWYPWGAWQYTCECGGTLVTPQHAVMAQHFKRYVGDRMRFTSVVDGVHTTYQRTIVGTANNYDCCLVALDSPLPEDITPMNIVGDWMWTNRTPSGNNELAYVSGLAFGLDQEKKSGILLLGRVPYERITDWLAPITLNGKSFGSLGLYADVNAVDSYFTIPQVSTKTAFNRPVILGDSGSPVMILVGGKPVLYTTWTTPSCGPRLHEDILNELILMADLEGGLDTGYTVTVEPDPTSV